MSVKKEDVEKNKVELEITVEADKFSDGVNKAAKKLAGKVNIPGFRKGKAPRRLVEQYLGTQALYNEALDNIIGPAYAEGVLRSTIQPVDQPEISLVQIEEGKELIFKAKVTVKPEVALGEYKGLKVEKEVQAVTDEQVEEELKRRQEQHAKLITLEDGSVEQGDTATIDFEGFVGDVAFEGGKGEDYDLVIGSGTFITGFEEQLIGAKTGQHVDVNVTFPDEYPVEEVAGKPAVFKVVVQKIKRKELAPLDDEFAKDISEFDTLDELKTDIRHNLEQAEERRAESAYQNAIVAKAADNASVEIPEVMINSRIDTMVHDLEHNLEYQGLDLEQYFAFTNTNEQEMRERFRSQAAESVKTELVLEKIAQVEGIQVSDEELNEELTKMAEHYQQSAEAIRRTFEARGELQYLRETLITDKTVKFLVDQNA